MVQRTSKQQLIELIEKLEDDEFIKLLIARLEGMEPAQEKVRYTTEQMASLRHASQQIQEGKSSTHDQVMGKARKILGR